MSAYDWRDDMHESWLFALQCARERIAAGGPWPACFGEAYMRHVKGNVRDAVGKRVTHCNAFVDKNGNDQVVILFDDGASLIVSEESQAGELGVVYSCPTP